MCKAKLPLRLGGQTRHLWRVEGTHCMARTHREIYNEEPDRIASTAEREKQELKEKSWHCGLACPCVAALVTGVRLLRFSGAGGHATHESFFVRAVVGLELSTSKQ
jgi:hypothetical protein